MAPGQRLVATLRPPGAAGGVRARAPDALLAAVRYGAVKVNLDTDAQYAFSRAVADHMLTRYAGVLRVDGGAGEKADYDPRSWGRAAERGMAARVAEACRLLGAAGRSLLG
jgi:fructose-bisphosphate aldolase class II